MVESPDVVLEPFWAQAICASPPVFLVCAVFGCAMSLPSVTFKNCALVKKAKTDAVADAQLKDLEKLVILLALNPGLIHDELIRIQKKLQGPMIVPVTVEGLAEAGLARNSCAKPHETYVNIQKLHGTL